MTAWVVLAPTLSRASVPSRAPAAINHAVLMITTPSKIFYGEDGSALSPDLIASYNQIRAQEKPWDVSKVIPLDMQPTTDSARVFSQVADRSVTTFFNSPEVRQSSFGQAATQVERKMKQEVVIGGEDPKSVQHKLNFSVQAFQAAASLQYSGITNAAVKYRVAENKVALEVFEKISKTRDMVLSHTLRGSERTSEVSVRWTF